MIEMAAAASVITSAATVGLWFQEKNRYDPQVIENTVVDLAIDAVPFAAGKIAKIGSDVRKADTLLQMIEDKRGKLHLVWRIPHS